MRCAALILAVIACDPPSPYAMQDDATRIIERVYVADGWGDLPHITALWYPDECLPDPWRYEFDVESGSFNVSSDSKCWNGKTLYLGPICVVAVRYRGASIASTSYAHELMHCIGPDSFHAERQRWDYSVPRANNAMIEAGL